MSKTKCNMKGADVDAEFWHQRWQNNQIGFHEKDVNPLLTEHLDSLGMQPGQRIFVPLCGKTRDIGWLLGSDLQVVGVELSDLAIQQLFAELDVMPEVSQTGPFRCYRTHHLTVFVGDFFYMDREQLGPVDAIYDRAALVALPQPMRVRYTRHLVDLTASAPQLLITYEYDSTLMEGPPFSVSSTELTQHYGDVYQLSLLANDGVLGGLKRTLAQENVWLLQPHPTE